MPIKAPKARACYICGRQTLLPGYDNHVLQCRALFEKREAQKPPKERRQCPPDPMSYMSSGKYGNEEEANAAAMKAWESTLSACQNCGRSFLPDKLVIHQRSCTASNPARRVNEGVRRATDQYGEDMGSFVAASNGSNFNHSSSIGNAAGLRGTMKSQMSLNAGGGGPPPMNNFPEYVMLNKCSNCGRNFNEVSYAKHVKICKKVFSQKRKPFDSAKHRAMGTELAEYLNSTRRRSQNLASSSSRMNASTASSSLQSTSMAKHKSSGGGKWRAESSAFRQAIRQAKMWAQYEQQAKGGGGGRKGGMALVAPPPMAPGPTPQELGYITCPTCGRSFNQQAGARHIPQCKNIINKPRTIRKGEGMPSYSTLGNAGSSHSSSGGWGRGGNVGGSVDYDSVSSAMRSGGSLGARGLGGGVAVAGSRNIGGSQHHAMRGGSGGGGRSSVGSGGWDQGGFDSWQGMGGGMGGGMGSMGMDMGGSTRKYDMNAPVVMNRGGGGANVSSYSVSKSSPRTVENTAVQSMARTSGMGASSGSGRFSVGGASGGAGSTLGVRGGIAIGSAGSRPLSASRSRRSY